MFVCMHLSLSLAHPQAHAHTCVHAHMLTPAHIQTHNAVALFLSVSRIRQYIRKQYCDFLSLSHTHPQTINTSPCKPKTISITTSCSNLSLQPHQPPEPTPEKEGSKSYTRGQCTANKYNKTKKKTKRSGQETWKILTLRVAGVILSDVQPNSTGPLLQDTRATTGISTPGERKVVQDEIILQLGKDREF